MSDVATLRAKADIEAQGPRMASKPREEVTFLIEGREIPVVSARISRSIDTVADGWTVEVEWIPGRDAALDARVSPYTYARAQIYIGTRLVNTGRIYQVTNHFGDAGLTKKLECASYTANLVDSDLPTSGETWEWSNSSIDAIARNICGALKGNPAITVGIGSAVYAQGKAARVQEPFDVVQASLTERCGEIMTRLAFQRGALVTNDRYGMLLITMGNSKGPIVAQLGEGDIKSYMQSLPGGKAKSQGWEATFNGRERWNVYNVFSASGDGSQIMGTSSDDKVIVGRVTNIVVSDNGVGNVGVSAAWHRSRQVVKALTIPFPVIGFYTPDGALWNPNDLVMVQAPSLDIPVSTRFLVRQVDYEYTAASETGTLYLVPPEVFTGEPVREPWSGRWT